MKRKTKKKLIQILLFLVKFNLLAIPLYILIFLNFSLPPLQNFVALLSHKLLSAIGIQSSLDQHNLIAIKEFKVFFVEISMDCTGWKSLYTLFALTIATPEVKIKRKFLFLLVSIPFLFFVNIGRIVLTIYLSLIEPESFAFVHDFLWQWGLILTIIGTWALWLKLEKRI
jgi:exosortase/archaeosortase family protein